MGSWGGSNRSAMWSEHLYNAAKRGPQPLSALLQRGRFEGLLINGASFAGRYKDMTALGIAAVENDALAAETLLDQGADPDVGQPLLHAINKGGLKVLRCLLAAGANPNVRFSNPNESAIMSAVRKGNSHADAVRDLLSAGAAMENSMLGVAYNAKQADLVMALAWAGANVDVTIQGDKTLLMHAAASGDFAMCKALLRYGCDLNKRNGEKLTVLMIQTKAGKGVAEIVSCIPPSIMNAEASDRASDIFVDLSSPATEGRKRWYAGASAADSFGPFAVRKDWEKARGKRRR